MSSTKEKILSKVTDVPTTGCNKICIIGVGKVGMACAITILSKRISTEICLIDKNENKVKGEVLDLQHGSSLIPNAKITGGTDLSLAAHSRVVIITAGNSPTECESRLTVLKQNAVIIKEIVPQIAKTCPHSIILVVTNPVDVLTFLAWKLSGFPKNRVFGTGTSIDSSRFRFLISERLNVAPSSCDAFVIGEHGESCVTVWSAVSVGGVSLRDLDGCIGIDEDEDHWEEVHCNVVRAADHVIQSKKHTNWAVGLCCATIVEAILMNTGAIIPLSTNAKGMYDIEQDIFLSLPCVVNANGITSVVKLNLTPYEDGMLKNSAKILSEAQGQLCLK